MPSALLVCPNSLVHQSPQMPLLTKNITPKIYTYLQKSTYQRLCNMTSSQDMTLTHLIGGGGSRGVSFPIFFPVISKYPLDICQNKKFPCLLLFMFPISTRICTIFPNFVEKIGQCPCFVLLGPPLSWRLITTPYYY